MIIAGIDPGRRGAIVIVDTDSLEVVASHRMPYVDKGLDLWEIADIIASNSVNLAVVEKQQSMPKQGVKSCFTIGLGFGSLLGVLAALKVPFVTPSPSKWTRRALEGIPGDGKARNILACRRLFPHLDLTPGRVKRPHDGIADAALLAYYGMGQGRPE